MHFLEILAQTVFFAGDSWMLQGQSQSTHRGLQVWESWWAPNLTSDRLPHSQGLPPASDPGGEQHGWGVMSWVSILHRAFTGLEDHMSNELLKWFMSRGHCCFCCCRMCQWLKEKAKGWFLWLIDICLFLFIPVSSVIDLQIFLSILFYSRTVTVPV